MGRVPSVGGALAVSAATTPAISAAPAVSVAPSAIVPAAVFSFAGGLASTLATYCYVALGWLAFFLRRPRSREQQHTLNIRVMVISSLVHHHHDGVVTLASTWR